MNDHISELRHRIKAVRVNAGLTQPQFAEQIEVSLPTVTRIEKGRSIPDLACVFKIAEIFNVSSEWLIFGERQGGNNTQCNMIPIYTESQLIDNNTNKETISYGYLPGLPTHCFLVDTKEQGMMPQILPNDLVIVVDEATKTGDAVIFQNYYGYVYIRKLGRIGLERKVFVAENPEYPLIDRNGEEKIFGKVIGVIRKYTV
jgi:DNA-binding XRE family transcriptional regulator